jgi:hypothetical protein
MKPFLAIVTYIKAMMTNTFNAADAVVSHYCDEIIVISAYVFGIFIASVCCPQRASATTLIVIIDKPNNTIILAADSKETPAGPAVPSEQRPPVCKIAVGPNCGFGLAGRVRGAFVKYDLPETASEACESDLSISQIAETFASNARGPLEKEFSLLKKYSPAEFAQLIKEKGDFAGAVFAGMEDGQVNAFARGFRISETGSLEPDDRDTTQLPDAQITMGQSEKISDYHTAHPKWYQEAISDGGLAKLAEYMIGLEIAERPDMVGPPISILELNHSALLVNPNGVIAHWIKPGVCN